MTLYTVVIKNMRQRSLASVLTITSIALGVALVAAILLINAEAQRNFYASSTGWDLIIGPKGSPLDLVLGAVFNLTVTSDTIPYSTYEELCADKRVDYAIPFCTGDSYREFRIVATDTKFFEKYRPKPPSVAFYRGEPILVPGKTLSFDSDDGRPWSDTPGEAVVGAFAAQTADLSLGSRFHITHGVKVADTMRDSLAHEDLPFTVCGVLKPTGTPVDKVIYVSLDTWFALKDHVDAATPAALSAPEDGSPDRRHSRLSFVGVRLEETADPRQLVYESRNESLVAQAVMPLQQIQLFFQNVLTWVSTLFVAIAVMVIVVSGIGVMVWIYNSMNERRRDIAIMRSLGAGRWTIFSSILFESAALCAAGAVFGIPLAHLVVQLAGDYIRIQSGAIIAAWTFSPVELLLLAGTVALGLLVGIFPAIKAYQTEVADNLQPLA